jgi:hypothetical protein
MNYCIALLAAILFISCEGGKPKNQSSPSPVTDASIADGIPTIDTSVILTGISKSSYRGQNLTDSLARQILYRYFERKGYYTDERKPKPEELKESDNYKLCAYYEGVFFVDLNGNKKTDAIVLYWLTPPYSNGHCVQPHKAIIVDTDKGYKVTNEEFLPAKFSIDSVISSEQNLTIHCADYECGNQVELKRFRLRIR